MMDKSGLLNKQDIEIKVLNTSDSLKTIVVFGAHHEEPLTPLDIQQAFQVLPIGKNSSVTFDYPHSTSVGAFYCTNHKTIDLGPFPAQPYSSWNIEFASPDDPGSMKKNDYDTSYDGYTIYNNSPENSNESWNGHRINVALYKGNRKLIVWNQLRVGDYVELKPTNMLYFCCMETNGGIDYPDQPHSGEDTDFHIAAFSHQTPVDLANFPNGFEVSVKEEPGSGMILFTTKSSFG